MKQTNTNAAFILGTATESGSYSHTIQFQPLQNGTVEVRRYMRDELMGNWAGDHGQPIIMERAAARAEWAKLTAFGYKRR